MGCLQRLFLRIWHGGQEFQRRDLGENKSMNGVASFGIEDSSARRTLRLRKNCKLARNKRFLTGVAYCGMTCVKRLSWISITAENHRTGGGGTLGGVLFFVNYGSSEYDDLNTTANKGDDDLAAARTCMTRITQHDSTASLLLRSFMFARSHRYSTLRRVQGGVKK